MAKVIVAYVYKKVCVELNVRVVSINEHSDVNQVITVVHILGKWIE